MRLPEILDRLRTGRAGEAEAAGHPWLAVGGRAFRALRDASAGCPRPVRRLHDLHRAIEILETSSCPGLLVDPRHLALRPSAALRLLRARIDRERVIVLDRKLPPGLRRLAEETGVSVCRPGRRRPAIPGVRSAAEPALEEPSATPVPAPLPRADRAGAPLPHPPSRLHRFAAGLLERQSSAPDLMSYVMEALQQDTGAARVSLLLLDEQRRDLVLAYGSGLDPHLFGALRCRLGTGIAGAAAEDGRLRAGSAEAGGPRAYGGSRYLVLPLGEEDAPAGVACLTDLPGDRLPGEEELQRLSHAARLAGRALEIADRLARAESLAGTDRLTGLANRLTFERVLAREVERAGRTGHPLAVAILDLDDFKQVNDTRGHPAGDRLLLEASRRLEAAVRDADLVARWGGEEFALVLPGTASARADAALEGAERARAAVGVRPVALGDGGELVRVTASAGIAFYPTNGRTAEALLAAADVALYGAKRAGKNRLERA